MVIINHNLTAVNGFPKTNLVFHNHIKKDRHTAVLLYHIAILLCLAAVAADPISTKPYAGICHQKHISARGNQPLFSPESAKPIHIFLILFGIIRL